MANFIRLKQIESGSALQTAADANTDFSQSVINIVVDNVEAILPTGVISGSSQLTASYDVRYVLSGSITQTTWNSISGKPAGIISSSAQLDILGYATTSSLDSIFATDTELAVTSSQIIDQGEF
jgi:hypothetical protein